MKITTALLALVASANAAGHAASCYAVCGEVAPTTTAAPVTTAGSSGSSGSSGSASTSGSGSDPSGSAARRARGIDAVIDQHLGGRSARAGHQSDCIAACLGGDDVTKDQCTAVIVALQQPKADEAYEAALKAFNECQDANTPGDTSGSGSGSTRRQRRAGHAGGLVASFCAVSRRRAGHAAGTKALCDCANPGPLVRSRRAGHIFPACAALATARDDAMMAAGVPKPTTAGPEMQTLQTFIATLTEEQGKALEKLSAAELTDALAESFESLKAALGDAFAAFTIADVEKIYLYKNGVEVTGVASRARRADEYTMKIVFKATVTAEQVKTATTAFNEAVKAGTLKITIAGVEATITVEATGGSEETPVPPTTTPGPTTTTESGSGAVVVSATVFLSAIALL